MSERLYYSEPFLTSFDALVSDVREVSRTQGQSLWQIALNRTAFYPSSGGQPHDTGILAATAPSGVTLRAPIVAVEEDEDGDGEIWHTTSKPLNAGTAVRGEIDWIRRRGHMQQHSGQHLLSAMFYRETGARTVSFHLGDAVSTINLAHDSNDLGSEQLTRVEDAVNEIIAEDRPIGIRIVSQDKAAALLEHFRSLSIQTGSSQCGFSLRKSHVESISTVSTVSENALAAGALRKLPEREGAIRLIEIEGVDLNACGGTHLRSTGQIGGLLIRGTEKVKQCIRVEFVCGLRAVEAARRDLASLSRAAASLSVDRTEAPGAVDRILAENKAARKERQRLHEELANYHAVRLLVETAIENGLRIVRRSFADHDGAYVKLLASRLTASAPQTCALLASITQEPAKVVAASSRDLEIDCGAALTAALAVYGARGGGSSGMAQGQISRDHVDALFSSLEDGFRMATRGSAGTFDAS